MKPRILDASALLAFLWQEPGWREVEAALTSEECAMSAVNVAEFVTKTQERGVSESEIAALFSNLPLRVVPHDQKQAFATGFLRNPTRGLGLSLGDRACLALALHENATVLTADRPWLDVAGPLGIDIVCIRPDAN